MAKIRKQTPDKLVGGQSTNNVFKPLSLISQTEASVRPTTKVSSVTDSKKVSSYNSPALKGIQFGSPSNAGVKSRSSNGASNEWTSLVKTASSGVASIIGGGFLESGVNSLVSGLTSLFDDGEKSEAPLVRFVLPDSQQQTMYVSSGGFSANPNSVEVYQKNPQQEPVYKQSEIVQAVKNALLTSCSLNDVIAEI